MLTSKTLEGGIAAFDAARDQFSAALDSAPDESLKFLKPGDDYALGGLVAHVDNALQHYLNVLDAMEASDFGDAHPVDPPGMAEAAAQRARAGLAPGERAGAMTAMNGLHAAMVARIRSLAGNWDRQAPVHYDGAAEPYPTTPADVIGWVTDHYLEHVPHVTELVKAWRG